MVSRRAQFAFRALLAIALWHVQVISAHAQQFYKPGSQPSNARQQQRPQSRQATPQNKTANQNGQQSLRTAAKSQAGAQAKPQAAEPTSIEKLDPEKRAAFLKLIGANWIWSPAYPKDEVPVGDCYFRKTFQVNIAEIAQVHVTCDNQYELYVNGRLVGRGADWRRMDVHDVQKLLVRGTNVVAMTFDEPATTWTLGAAAQPRPRPLHVGTTWCHWPVGPGLKV